MKFGISLPNSGPLVSLSNISEVAEAADRLGFDSVWTHDHQQFEKRNVTPPRVGYASGNKELVQQTGYAEKPDFYECLITLAYVSAITRNVKLGTAILVLPQRQPVIVAKEIATLDALSQGRVIFGVGVGLSHKEYEVVGRSRYFEKRGRVVDEYLDLVKKIWTEKVVDFNGNFISFQGGCFFPKPKHIPIWYGGNAFEKSLRRVARFADGWFAQWEKGDPQSAIPFFEKNLPILEKIANEYGRSINDIEIAAEMYSTVANSREEALRICGPTLTEGLGERWEEYAMVGSPQDIVKKIEALEEAGLEHVRIKFISSGQTNLLNQIK
jgi:probable F420-dependent oxidoreductase